MAKKDDAEVILDDEGTVTVDVSDDPKLAAAAEEGAADDKDEAEVAPVKKPVERKRLTEAQDDEATKALTEAQALAADEAKKRQAAEARAQQEAQARVQAEQRATNLQQEAEDARATAEQSQMSLLDSGIESAKNEVAAYETQLAAAYETGDFKAVAAIQTKLSTSAAKVDRLEASKEAFESGAGQRKAAPTEGRVVTAQAPSQVDTYLSQMSPAAQAWLRDHPECLPAQLGGDGSANSKMMAGHYSALAQNIVPNTPDYFRVIEEHTGHRKAMSAAADLKAAGDDDEVAPPPKKAAKPPVAAPPSREPPTAQGKPSGKVSVTLSKDEQEMARVSFPNLTPQQAYANYARNKIELQSEGKLGRTTH